VGVREESGRRGGTGCREKMPTRRGGIGEGLSRREFIRLGTCGALGSLLPGGLAGCGRGPEAARERPNILLITLDTTRRDRLGCYGCELPTSPSLDSLAGESLLFTRAIAPSNWTLPSHASLFTGKFTTSHGARFDAEGPLSLGGHLEGPREFWGRFRARGLSTEEVTLASILSAEGYVTGGVAAGPWLKRAFGLHRGFSFWDDDGISTENGRPADGVTASALKWLRGRDQERFFLFLNYFDPHIPYYPPAEFARLFLPKGTDLEKLDPRRPTLEERRALYSAEVRFMDEQIGRLLKEMKALGIYDNTWIIVASDHGELLGEHGLFGHGKRLYQEEIHIPLFMKYPLGEVAPREEDDFVQLTDIMALVLERLELPSPPGIQGGIPPRTGHPPLAEIYPLEFLSPEGDSKAIYRGDLKYVWNAMEHHGLYDLARDPGEEVNLIADRSGEAREMKKSLLAYLGRLPGPAKGGREQIVDEETREALKGLGYLK
jgi:arylsulfatase A-like enzyme